MLKKYSFVFLDFFLDKKGKIRNQKKETKMESIKIIIPNKNKPSWRSRKNNLQNPQSQQIKDVKDSHLPLGTGCLLFGRSLGAVDVFVFFEIWDLGFGILVGCWGENKDMIPKA